MTIVWRNHHNYIINRGLWIRGRHYHPRGFDESSAVIPLWSPCESWRYHHPEVTLSGMGENAISMALKAEGWHVPAGFIKHGWLENPPGMEVFSWENHWFLWSIFQHAMFDYQRVNLGKIHGLGLHGFHPDKWSFATFSLRQSNSMSMLVKYV